MRECTSMHARHVRACMYQKALRRDGCLRIDEADFLSLLRSASSILRLPEHRRSFRSRLSVLAFCKVLEPQAAVALQALQPLPRARESRFTSRSCFDDRWTTIISNQTIPTNVRWRQASATPTTRTDTESKCKNRLASSQITLPIAPATRQPPPRTSATTMEAPARA